MNAATLPAAVRELRDLLNTYLEPHHVAMVLRAYELGARAHAGQKRRSGEDYITHPVAVAAILAEMRMDHETVVAAILHDTMEDTSVTRADLVEQFGENVAALVEGVTKIDKMRFRTRKEADAESFRKLLLAMSRDLRVIFIKLGDRLHNMRTIDHMSVSAQRRISAETLEIYAPIADRLGMNELREELEELGFRHLHPYRARVLAARVRKSLGRRNGALDEVTETLRKRLNEMGVVARVEGRAKTLYSIYCKMRDKSMPFDQLMDLYAVRIVTQSLPECYQALGVVHSLYRPKMGSFKDYIALPKPNGYQSLHTVVNARLPVPVEVQIRTRGMDDMAKKGAAAHWLYKSSPNGETAVRARSWLLKLVETQGREADSEQFIADAKAELFPDEIFVFTPGGKIIDLKANATALDFAYAIHTDVGNQAVGAYVDREKVPLNSVLHSGETVEIITRKGEKPKAEWHEFVVTSKARSSIRAHLKNLQRADSVEIGNRLLDQALARRGYSLESVAPRRLERYLKKNGIEELEDLLTQIARGDKMAHLVADGLLSRTQRRSEEDESEALTVGDTKGAAVSYAKCCSPIPGDPIMGYLSPGKGLVIHRQRCPNVPELRKNHPDQCLKVRWASLVDGFFSTRLKLITMDTTGVLASVTATVSEAGSNIEQVEQPPGTHETAVLKFTLAVRDRQNLARVIRRLRRNRHVIKVSRDMA